MDYQTSVAFIHAQPRLAKDGSHTRINTLLKELGHPERTGRFIHVTGTNGKGAVASATAHILEASGLTVGLFTSPYLMRFNERFMIDHQPITDLALAALTTQVAAALQAIQQQTSGFIVTEFEFVTAMAFTWFAAQGVDVAVMEVGIGGDTDSTNVLSPAVSVITSVGLDHQALLGETLTSVATHKAGIVKPGAPVVTGALPEAALAVVQARVAATKSPWRQYGTDFDVTHAALSDWGTRFDYHDEEGALTKLTVPLVGTYQAANMAVAIQTAKQYAKASAWSLASREIRQGLAASRWFGRMERLSEDPLIVLDGAHNPQAAVALKATLDQLFGKQPVTIIAGMLQDKALDPMLVTLNQPPYRLWLVPVPGTSRAAPLEAYPNAVPHFSSWQAALAQHLADYADEPVVITGSLYLVAAVRQTLMEEHDEDDSL